MSYDMNIGDESFNYAYNVCRRHMAYPDKNQSYADFKYVKGDGCEYFIKVKKR